MQAKLHTLVVLATIALVASTVTSAIAPRRAVAQEFSADVVQTPQRGIDSTKLYVGSSKLRFENYQGGQAEGGVIWDFVNQAITLVMDREKEYIGGSNTSLVSRMMTQSGAPPLWRMFHPTNPGDPCTEWNAVMQAVARTDSTQVKTLACHSLGTESVNGRQAQKWGVTSTSRSGQSQTGTVWIDSRLHVVTKSQDNTGTMQLVNIQEGAQPASVFMIPASYRAVDVRQMMARMKIPGGDSLAAALGKAARDVGDSAASNTASAAKTQATTSVTKKLKGILRLP